jgi:hypothetical protein
MRIVLTLASLILSVGIAAADGLPRATAGTSSAPAARTAPAAIVTRDDARRQVTAWILSGEPQATGIAPAAVRVGRLIVRNRSGFSADVYLALPADEPQWEFVDEVPTGFKLIVHNLTRRADYLIAAEETNNYDGSFDWGPREFFMRKRFRFTLLP